VGVQEGFVAAEETSLVSSSDDEGAIIRRESNAGALSSKNDAILQPLRRRRPTTHSLDTADVWRMRPNVGEDATADQRGGATKAMTSASASVSKRRAAQLEEEELQTDKAMEAAVERGLAEEKVADKEAHAQFMQAVNKIKDKLSHAKLNADRELAKAKQRGMVAAGRVKQRATVLKRSMYDAAATQRNIKKEPLRRQVVGLFASLEDTLKKQEQAIAEDERRAVAKAKRMLVLAKQKAKKAYEQALAESSTLYQKAATLSVRKQAVKQSLMTGVQPA